MTAVVDLDDLVIGSKPRSQITTEDIYRIGSLFIINPEKKLLLAKRAATKKHSPNKWAPTVNGTVQLGQTYLENIIIETKEEIGLVLPEQEVVLGSKVYSEGNRKHFCQFSYFVLSDKEGNDLVPEPEEISELCWWSIPDIIEGQAQDPKDFVSSFSPVFFPKIINDINQLLL